MTAQDAAAIVVAAGRGARIGASVAKAFLLLRGRPLLLHAVAAVEQARGIGSIVVLVAHDDISRARDLLDQHGLRKVSAVIAGGAERQDSVYAGLPHTGDAGIIVVHDGARPLVSVQILEAVVQAAAQVGAAAAGVPIRETVKQVDGDTATDTLDRSRLWVAHTPQAFRSDLLREAHRRAHEQGMRASDDAALVEQLGHPVQMVLDTVTNLKITVPEDLVLAEAMLQHRHGAATRTGLGVDAHRLVMGRRLILGGVDVPSPLGLAGHSDADVLTHAIMDAILGAAGLGDIGRQFPEKPAYKDADSLDLLRQVVAMAAAEGWRIAHVDTVILADAPRLAPHIEAMRRRLAPVLGLDTASVSIKATTMEGLGAVGRGEGIVAHAVATLDRA